MKSSDKYYKELPKKRLSSAVIFFNNNQELLIVKPGYKDHWSLVGGTVDNNESPLAAAKREVKEEIGLMVKNITLCGIDYVPDKDGKGERIQFIFYGGVIDDYQIKNINLPEIELERYKFINKTEVEMYLSKETSKRLLNCLNDENKVFYMEEGVAT